MFSAFGLLWRLLPSAKRRARTALYAFCRTTDDLVDAPGDDAGAALAAWRARATAPAPPPDDPVALAWADTRARYGIPRRCAKRCTNWNPNSALVAWVAASRAEDDKRGDGADVA